MPFTALSCVKSEAPFSASRWSITVQTTLLSRHHFLNTAESKVFVNACTRASQTSPPVTRNWNALMSPPVYWSRVMA